MQPIYVDWATFKSFVTSRNLSIQYVIIDSTYRMRAFDGYFYLDASVPVDGGTDCIDFETNYKSLGNKTPIQSIPVQSIPPFGSKTILVGGVAKKLYARNTGIQSTVTAGSNIISYTATYPWAKILGVEAVGCEALDTADFRVYDTAGGTYSGVPNALLNQFSYSLNLPAGYYLKMAEFDADLYAGMIIQVTYNSISNKTVGINLLMNEVK